MESVGTALWMRSGKRSIWRVIVTRVMFGVGGFAACAHAQVPIPLANPNLSLVVNGRIAVFARQSDGHIVLGGHFSSIDGVARANIARLNPDGTLDIEWNPSADNEVDALAVDTMSGAVFAGGYFTHVGGQARNHLAKIDGSGVGAIDTAFNPSANQGVNALVAIGSSIYAGGSFTSIGGQPRNYLARLSTDGVVDSDWNPTADNVVDALALDVDGTFIYAGGAFSTIGGQARSHLAKLVTSGTGSADASWNPSADATVLALAPDTTGNLYVGGYFTTISGAAHVHIARLPLVGTGVADPAWNPTTDDVVKALLPDASGFVYIGGYFENVGALPHHHLAKLSSSGGGDVENHWNASTDGPVYALMPRGNGVVSAGGEFAYASGQSSLGFASMGQSGDRISGTPSIELPGSVQALAAQTDGGMIVGGRFERIGQTLSRRNLLRLRADGTLDPVWAPAANSEVLSLAIGGDGSVFAGGDFTQIDGQPHNRIARLTADGIVDSAWRADADGAVLSIAVSGGSLYAGGTFTTFGGLARNRIAKASTVGVGVVDPVWNPSANDSVYAIAIDSSDMVYAGGVFSFIGGTSRNHLAKFSGSGNGAAVASWNPNANNIVTALVVDGTGVYVGGYFNQIGVAHRESIAKLSASGAGTADSAWTPFLLGIPDAFVLDGHGALFVGGNFTILGTPVRRNIQKLSTTGNGNADAAWNASIEDSVNVLAVSAGQALFVGGSFTAVSAQPRIGVAALPLNGPRSTTLSFSPVAPQTTVTGQPYQVSVSIVASSGTPTGTVTISDGLGATCGPAPLTSGAASCSLTSTSSGLHTLTASYVPTDVNQFVTSTQTTMHTVESAMTSLSITSDIPAPSIPTQAVTVALNLAVVSPGSGSPSGTITIGDGVDSCVVAQGDTSCTMTMTTRGTRTLVAIYAGDSNFNASTAQVTHNVNRLPIVSTASHAANEDVQFTLSRAQGVLAGASDPDGDALTITNAGTLTAAGIGGTVNLNSDGSYDYTPPANANGIATFDYVVSDGHESVTATATITVAAVNDAPEFALSATPSWPAGASGVKTQAGFASVTSFGPADEAGQHVQGWIVRPISDPNGVASSVAIAPDGTLGYTLSGQAGTATFGVKLQDDGGSANGGNDTSDEQTFAINVAAGLDLSISIDDGTDFAPGGGTVVYTIIVHNVGPNGAIGAKVRDPLPFNLFDAGWTCEATVGASCTPSGSGDIEDTVTIPNGATLTYVLGANVLADPEVPVANTASVIAPVNVPDTNAANDAATDTDEVGIFADGFDREIVLKRAGTSRRP